MSSARDNQIYFLLRMALACLKTWKSCPSCIRNIEHFLETDEICVERGKR